MNNEEITIKDIARLCGVGVSTVSRAINNHPDINSETKELIMSVIKEKGYIPNNSARNLKRTEANNIAVLVKGITNPFFNVMIKSIEADIGKHNCATVICHVDENEDEVDVALSICKEKRLKGLIFLGGYFENIEAKMEKLNVPFVVSTAGARRDTTQKYSSVSIDDEEESCKAVKYLISQGHSNIAIFAAAHDDAGIGALRLNGYKRALRESGIEVNDSLIRYVRPELEPYSLESGYTAAKELLAEDMKFSAIFAISDMMAIGACRALADSGLNIPKDVSVMGFDGIELGKYFIPSITTLAQPIEQMAAETTKLLFEVIDEKKECSCKIFNGELLERESVAKKEI